MILTILTVFMLFHGQPVSLRRLGGTSRESSPGEVGVEETLMTKEPLLSIPQQIIGEHRIEGNALQSNTGIS